MSVNIELRTRILTVARRLFFTNGIKRVTVDEIAVELGIGKATLYEHFQSKNILVGAVLEDKRSEMEETLNEINDRIKNTKELNMIELIKELILFGSNELSEMKEPFIREVGRYVSSFSIEMDFYDLIRVLIEELLERGRRENAIRSDINIQIFSEILFCLINNIISNLEFAAIQNVTRNDVMDTTVKVLLTGLLAEEVRSEYISQS